MVAERVLLVEDDNDLASTILYNLENEGYQTQGAATGGTALELAQQEPIPDLVILDLMLPDIPGTEVCRKLKGDAATRHIPVMIASARSEEIDRVVGFEVGADDYLVKPFSVRELVLRVRAILRRTQTIQGPGTRTTVGRLRIDPEGHRVWIDEREVHLTTLEFRLLHQLLDRRGRVQSRDQLLEDVWGQDAEVTPRTVDTHIMRLRHKLGPLADYIETLRGTGYRLRTQFGSASSDAH